MGRPSSMIGAAARSDDDGWRPQTGFAHRVGDRDSLDQLNHSGGIAVQFAPLPGGVHLAFDGSQSDSLSIWRTTSERGFISSPRLEADLVSIRFVDRGAMSRIDQRGTDLSVGFGQVLVSSYETMRLEQTSPGFSAITATVRRTAMIEAARVLDGDTVRALPRFDTVVDVRTAGLAAMRVTLSSIHRRLTAANDDADLMAPLLEELLLYQLIGSWPSTGEARAPTPVDPADHAVRRAVDFIEGHLGRRIALRDIAAAAGISVRSLQMAFKRRLGCSPLQYLIARRLDRVHAHLQVAEGETIRHVASTWGFVHMSDFARRYRERFGQLPSARRE